MAGNGRGQIIDQLRDTLGKMELSLNAIDDAIVWLDEKGIIQWCNEKFDQLLGRLHMEILGNPISTLLPLKSKNKISPWKRILARAENKGSRSRSVWYEFEINNKKTFLEIDSNRFNKTQGDSGIVVVLHDITDRLRLTEKERQNWSTQALGRLRNELLGNISHELRTPLNAIIGYSEIIQEEIPNSGTKLKKEYFTNLVSSANHLNRLIDDLLRLSEIEFDRVKFQYEHVNLIYLVNEVTNSLEKYAQKKQIHLTISISPEVATAYLDPHSFKYVVYHYLSNAIKFTPLQGSVIIRINPEDKDNLRLEVEDTGIGITPADSKKLFVAFQQIDSGQTKKYPGIGLGLALTKQAVEAHGGQVGVISSPGKGSIFYAVMKRSGAA